MKRRWEHIVIMAQHTGAGDGTKHDGRKTTTDQWWCTAGTTSQQKQNCLTRQLDPERTTFFLWQRRWSCNWPVLVLPTVMFTMRFSVSRNFKITIKMAATYQGQTNSLIWFCKHLVKAQSVVHVKHGGKCSMGPNSWEDRAIQWG